MPRRRCRWSRTARRRSPRGDDSGTHRKELALWEKTGADPAAVSGGWYRETGSGMGAYALTDRGTWISFENKGELAILVEGDEALFNRYGVIPVNSEHGPLPGAS
jgi:tungstate transport system substrate-binding protein